MFSSTKPVATVKKKNISACLITHQIPKCQLILSNGLLKNLTHSCKSTFHCQTPFTIASFFRTEDKPSTELLFNKIYIFTYELYCLLHIVSTQRSSKCGTDYHRGISSRTRRRLATVMHHLPRIHAKTSNYKIHANNFSFIDYSRNVQDLPMLKYLHILKQKPDLNGRQNFTHFTYPRNL